MPSRVYIITGAPASGKTTMGRLIAVRLSIPFLSKDTIKESLCDSFGRTDREFSGQAGCASMDLLYALSEELLKAGSSFVIEANFRPGPAEVAFAKMSERYAPAFMQIVCKADAGVRMERFKRRIESGERHPGHADLTRIGESKAGLIHEGDGRLAIDGIVTEIDTNDFSKLDLEPVLLTALAM